MAHSARRDDTEQDQSRTACSWHINPTSGVLFHELDSLRLYDSEYLMADSSTQQTSSATQANAPEPAYSGYVTLVSVETIETGYAVPDRSNGQVRVGFAPVSSLSDTERRLMAA